jgi:flagellar protein FliJ
MSPRFPLQTLLDLSQLRLDDAARQLGALMNGELEARQRVTLLIDYRAEYRARFTAASQSGLPPSEWQNFRSFLVKLDQAVDQAQAMFEQSQRNTAHGQRQWLEKRSNVKAYDTLADRHRQSLVRQESRREQKLGDEHSARKFHTDNNGSNEPDDESWRHQ